MPSVQLQRYLQERADGKSVDEACYWSGIDAGEAKLHERDIESGDLELPRARARTREDEPKGDEAMLTLDTPENAEAKQDNDMFAKPATDTGQCLRLFIERAERLDAEIKDLNEDKSEVFKEAKANGFDTKAIKQIIKLRKMKPHERQTAEAVLNTYMDAIGMTPIEQAIALAA